MKKRDRAKRVFERKREREKGVIDRVRDREGVRDK